MWTSKFNQNNFHLDNSVYGLQNKESFLTTGCTNIDLFLRGGLPQKGVTQIYGESGTGKTQLALQLCIATQIHGGAAYICTEASFPSSRFNELLKKSSMVGKYPISNEMVFIEHVSNTEDLEDCIYNSERLPQLLHKCNIKLLVIDSIAATYRIQYDLGNLKNRAKSLRNIGYNLLKLASIHAMTIICINQVTAVIGNNSLECISKEQPSLGITWANMITNSLYMYKKHNRRYLCIVGSSYLPCKKIEYEILDSGVKAKDVYKYV